jgi:hypothetical protein
MSTPADTNMTPAECLNTCGLIFFYLRDGIVVVAASTY